VDFLDDYQPTMVVHGGATGADALVDRWAINNSIPRVIFGVSDGGAAGWKALGFRAGPMRNQAMIDFLERLRDKDMFGMPLWVVGDTTIRALALPGRGGTDDMVGRCRHNGIIVFDHRQNPKALEGSVYAQGMQRR
jgi:hypothetical protein